MSDQPTDEQLEAAFEDQQALVDESLPAMFAAYDAAQEDGFEAPVVVVLDCEDELGAVIARSLLGDEIVDEAIAEQHAEAEDSFTVFTAAFPWDECRERTVEYFPYLAEAFENGPPTDGFLVIGVTSGGAAAFTAPFDARPE